VLVCDTAAFAPWTPDFSSSGQASPTWTRMTADGVELVNSMEDVPWRGEEVQMLLCEECGFPGCRVGGWVRIVRLGAHLVWVPVAVDPENEREREEYAPPPYLREAGAIAIAAAAWDGWRDRFAELPPADEFPPARRRDVAAAWLLEVPGGAATLQALAERVLPAVAAAAPLDRDAAVAAVARLAAWLADGDAPVAGELRATAEVGAVTDVLVLARPRDAEWRPLARTDGALAPAFRGERTLDPLPLADA
jgi:hypothetical protein